MMTYCPKCKRRLTVDVDQDGTRIVGCTACNQWWERDSMGHWFSLDDYEPLGVCDGPVPTERGNQSCK